MISIIAALLSTACASTPLGVPKPPSKTSTKLIPLPIYATLPNEGNTFGFMPVFLTVRDFDQHTESIVAPSVSWNKIIRFTGTFRLYYYPTPDMTLTVIPSVSEVVNRGLTLEFADLPRGSGALTYDGYTHPRRDIFRRFFGIGPNTHAGDESSYTRLGFDVGGRVGYNILKELNVGFSARLERLLVERQHVDFLPLTNDVFPGTPGLGGATTLAEGVSFRYDTRDDREYSRSGVYTEAFAGIAGGLSGTPSFGRFSYETKVLWDEASWAIGGARAYWSYSAGHDIPFFDQSSLGGSFRLRGFTEDRFIDKGAWEVEIEQRITLFQLHIYGVTSDWRVDPFIGIGQVYEDASTMFASTRIAGGLGFRAFVHPNVLGRVDVAAGGEGLKIYVELGYPF
jgi:hypothetical protein